jgi:hypothetical protein
MSRNPLGNRGKNEVSGWMEASTSSGERQVYSGGKYTTKVSKEEWNWELLL